MATKEQKQELIDTLKFTPRTYTVSVYGYGGEIVMGTFDSKIAAHFRQHRINVSDYATGWDDDEFDVPEELRPFEPGGWYECDNVEHCSGAEFGGATIQVTDENGTVVWEQDLGHGLEDHGCEIECFCEEIIDEYVTDDTSVFVGQSVEKGTFFDGPLELRRPFDPAKFKFVYSEIAGWPILNLIEYDGIEIEGQDGYSTTGKSSNYSFYYKNIDGDVLEYDYATDVDEDEEPESACTSETNDVISDEEEEALLASIREAQEDSVDKNVTDWYDSTIKPVHKGEYECEFKIVTWPWPAVRMCEWTGRSWKDSTGEKVKGEFKWRGLKEKAE